MAKKSSSKQHEESMLMGVLVIIAIILGAVVVMASQKYSAVKEIESQVETDSVYQDLLEKPDSTQK